MRSTAKQVPAVLYAKHGNIGIITLNRPRVLNAYNVAMRDGLFEALGAVRDDPEVLAVVLHGNGPAFCTGGDVAEFGSAPSPAVAREVRWRRDVWGVLRSLPKPSIAAVHGYVVGGGFEMALLCDLCVASVDARFAYPETGMAMIPGVVGTQTTPRLLGVGRALDLILTGRWLTADDAWRLGIVARCVARDDLLRSAIDLASRLCELRPGLIARLKRAVDLGLDMPLEEALRLERRLAVCA